MLLATTLWLVGLTAVPAQSATLPFIGTGAAVQQYARSALDNPHVTCSATQGRISTFAVLRCATGLTVGVGGFGSTGVITVQGSDGQVRTGSGLLILKAGSQWNPSTGKPDWIAGSLGQFIIDTGASLMPASQSDAERLYDDVMGSNARRGVPMGFTRRLFNRGGEVARWGAIAGNGPNGLGAGAGGLVLIRGKVYAIHATAFGSYSGHVAP